MEWRLYSSFVVSYISEFDCSRRRFVHIARKYRKTNCLPREAENMMIRTERREDIPHVRKVNELAFEQTTEADIVDKIRNACAESISLVADDGRVIAGHIFFSPVVLHSSAGNLSGMGLGPMAVLPDRQRQGIGSGLVRRGLEILRETGCPFVIVLGHPAYYPRFGFEPASRYGLRCQWDGIPDEAFMVLILDRTAMDGVTGEVRYRAEFAEAV